MSAPDNWKILKWVFTTVLYYDHEPSEHCRCSTFSNEAAVYVFGFSGKMWDNTESLRIQLHANLTTKSALWESVAQNIFPVETRTR